MNAPEIPDVQSGEAFSIWLNQPTSTIIKPPVRTLRQELPFDELDWDEFERLCVRVIYLEGEIEHCQRYGTLGQAQQGIDVYARNSSDDSYSVYQCKKVSQFRPSDLRAVVEKFLSGYWADKATSFTIAISLNATDTRIADEFEDQVGQLKAKGIALTLWDAQKISYKLKDQPSIVDDFFGTEWTKDFCGRGAIIPRHDVEPDLEGIDLVIVNQFPYPVAKTFYDVLSSSDPNTRTMLCLNIFRYIMRTFAFSVLIKYLEEDPQDDINDPELNSDLKMIREQYNTHIWIQILERCLKAYKNRRQDFFIPEIWDLYWQDQVSNGHTEPQFWEAAYALAAIEADIGKSKKNSHSIAVSNDLLEKLRELLNHLLFLTGYELWYVKGQDDDTQSLKYDLYKGRQPKESEAKWDLIDQPGIGAIKSERFFLQKLDSLRHHRLLELHPIVVSSALIQALVSDGDIGVYQSYSTADALSYLMLNSGLSGALEDEDFKSFFRHLFDSLIPSKEKVHLHQLPSTIDGLREACRLFTENQVDALSEKYVEQAYVDRVEFDWILDAFFKSDKYAVAITGNAGTGKTSLLAHYYLHTLVHNVQAISLWIDGPSIRSDQCIDATILSALEQHGFPVNPSYADGEIQARRALAEILRNHLSEETLVLIFDGINENQNPVETVRRVTDFLADFPELSRVKILLTSRPQVWRYARRAQSRFRSDKYFNRMPETTAGHTVITEEESFVLSRFGINETHAAFDRYTSYYNISNPTWDNLTQSLRDAMRDPLLMRLTCEAYRDESIPSDLETGDIVQRLIDRQLNDINTNLRPDDVEFLTEKIVPLFLPENGKPRASLNRIDIEEVVSGNTTIHRLVVDDSPDTDGNPFNEQFQRLADNGWLVRNGPISDYEIRFRYEYYFDYFVGRYLSKRHQLSESASVFIEVLTEHLDEAPFLWGSARNLFIDMLGTESGLAQIERAGSTSDLLLRDLLYSVLTEQYPRHEQRVGRLLNDWITNDGHGNAGSLAARVSVKCRVQDVVKRCVVHSNPTIRQIVTKSIPEFWTVKEDRDLVCDLFSILVDSSKTLNPLKVRSTLVSLNTLFGASILLVLHEYIRSSANSTAYLMVVEAWKPIISRFFLVSNIGFVEALMRPFRRRILGIFAHFAVRMLKGIERPGFTFNAKELSDFFPPNEVQKSAIRRLIPHLDAAVDPSQSIEELVELIEELARAGQNNFVLVEVTLGCLVAHLHADPLRTTNAIDGLLHRLDEVYPATTDIANPTAALWYAIPTYPFLMLNYRGMDRNVAEQILEVWQRQFIECEIRYRNRFLFESGESVRISSAESVIFGYELGYESAGRVALEKLTNFLIDERDHEQIQLSVYALAVAISRYGLPQAGAEAMHDLIQILLDRDYFSIEDVDESQFWQESSDALVKYSGDYRSELGRIISLFEADQLPIEFRTTLLHASREAIEGTEVGEALAFSLGEALADKENDFFRERIKLVVNEFASAQSLKGVFVRLFQDISELLFTERRLFR